MAVKTFSISVNRGDVFAHKGLGRAGYVAIVSNDGFNAITRHPLVVKISDRPDLTETSPGHLVACHLTAGRSHCWAP